MNPAIVRMIMATVGPEQIAEMIDGLTAQMIDYKNSFALMEGEEEIVIILYENGKKIAYTIAAMDEHNKIVRQIETDYIQDLFLKLLKQQKDA